MSCAACSASIERSLSRKNFIQKIEVDLINAKALVVFDENLGSESAIIAHIQKLGYGAKVAGDSHWDLGRDSRRDSQKDSPNTSAQDSHQDSPKNAAQTPQNAANPSRDYLIAIIFAIPLFSLSMSAMFWHFESPNLLAALEALLLLPILFAGRKIFIKGFRALFNGVPNMDSLVALGSGAAVVYSVFMALFSPSDGLLHHLYFESAGVIIAVIMLGKMLENKATSAAKSALDSLIKMTPKVALRRENSEVVERDLSAIKLGDKIVVKIGAMVPLDGLLQSPSARLDEAIITGESKPKNRAFGELVYSGSVNLGEQITLKVAALEADSMIGKIISLMQGVKKAPIARVADVVSAYFVPAIIALAVLGAVFWWFYRGDLGFSFVIFSSVLLISCPCALGLATPLSILVATNAAFSRAIFFKSGEVLENAANLGVVVLDKTGTLTKGDLSVLDFVVKNEANREKILQIAALLEAKSEHLIAKAIVGYARIQATDSPLDSGVLGDSRRLDSRDSHENAIKTQSGLGISGEIGGVAVKIGSAAFVGLDLDSAGLDSWLSAAKDSPHTIAYIALNNELCGYFLLGDSLRKGTENLAKNLARHHIDCVILSGDRFAVVRAVAARCGIEKFYAQKLPDEKLALIESLQNGGGGSGAQNGDAKKNGVRVAFVGDGVNDAPALKKSNCAISLSSANDIAINSADIVLLGDDLGAVCEAIVLAKKTLRNIKQNLAFAFIYNACAIPIALGLPRLLGFDLTLTPMIAGVAMALSSLSVVCNALRLKNA